MKFRCPDCSQEYESPTGVYPFCPNCVKNKQKHSGFITPEHTQTGAKASTRYKTYISSETNGDAIFSYMTGEHHSNTSGCKVFLNTKHGSLNAVSLEPLGLIPGSGVDGGVETAKEFAVLYDIEGKSSHGPHFGFHDKADIDTRIRNGNLVELSLCSKCQEICVAPGQAVCLRCQGYAIGAD